MRRIPCLVIFALLALAVGMPAGALAVELGYVTPYYGSGNFENCYRLRRNWTHEGWRRQWKNICNNSGAYGARDPNWRWW